MKENNSERRNKLAIIGGGFSGLATAALLAKAGWQVTLFEKNKTFGGRARVLRKNGFTFDMGPSWYLMPEVFEQYFSLFQTTPEKFYTLIRLNPRYKVIFADQSELVLTDSIEENAKLFEQIEKGAGQNLKNFLDKMQKLYGASTRKLMSSNIYSWRTWTDFENWKAIFQITQNSRFWKSWNSVVSEYFQSEKLKQILGFAAVFLGGTPFNTPSLYSILTWADFGKGVWYPKGGMGKIVSALVHLAESSGVKLHAGEEVTEIEVESGKVRGVKTRDKKYAADIVIGASDLPHLQSNLLPEQYRDWNKSYWDNKTLGISALLLYLGINKKLKNAQHHTIYFSKDWKTNFDEIFVKKCLPTDPSMYMSIRSVTDTALVPKNSEEVFVLVPLGSKTRFSPDKLDQFSKKIETKVGHLLGFDEKSEVKVKETFTPDDFSRDYHAFGGTALGLAHTLDQSLWWRPANKSHKVKGLYYTGQYTQPGVGVPMALISAELVAGMIGSPSSDSADAIFRRGSTTYYYSSLFFDGQVKDDVFTLYAYVRTIDDLVDCPTPKTKEFNRLYEETVSSWKRSAVSNSIVSAFVALAKRKDFRWSWIDAFWTAMKSDLNKKVYYDFAELEEYMHGSAEVIGLMMAEILGLPRTAYTSAALQGKAMQYLNFIRDVKEDEEMGRNYLGYTQKQKHGRQWEDFIKRHIIKYRQLQKESEQGYRYIPRKYLIPIKTAAQMYQWTADQIMRSPSRVWHQKIKPNKLRVISTILKNFMTR